MAQEPTTNDDFSFDNFLGEDSKRELGITEQPQDTTTAKAEESQPVETVSESAPVTESKQEEVQTDVTDSSSEAPVSGAPVRAAGEPEWKYNYRVELFEKQQALKNASSDAERKEIRKEMTEIRKDMAETAKSEDSGEVDSDKIAKAVRQQLAYERQVETIDRAEMDFLKRHPDIKADPAKYDLFTNYVAETYILTGKSYHGITNALENAYSDLYPSTVEQKQKKAESVASKVAAADFSGSSATDEELPPEEKETKELVKNLKASPW